MSCLDGTKNRIDGRCSVLCLCLFEKGIPKKEVSDPTQILLVQDRQPELLEQKSSDPADADAANAPRAACENAFNAVERKRIEFENDRGTNGIIRPKHLQMECFPSNPLPTHQRYSNIDPAVPVSPLYSESSHSHYPLFSVPSPPY